MHILYCSYSVIPSNTANSIAVMKQCSALSKISKLKVILIKGKDYKSVNYCDLYNVEKMELILLPRFMLKFNEMGLKLFTTLYILLYKPQLVYSRDIFLNHFFCKFKINSIYEMHQLTQNDDRFDVKYKKSLKNIIASEYLKKIICISDTLKEECIEFGVDVHKLEVLHSGVDLNEVYTKKLSCDLRKMFLDPNRHMAIYTGSLQPGKGVETIVQMSNLSTNYNYLIVGGQFGEIECKSNLQHIPWCQHEEVIGYLKQADFLILPQVKQKYTFHSPLKLFEYMSVGKVIIASDLPNIKEIIRHGENGLLAEEKNPEDFIKQMDSVIMDIKLKCSLEFAAKETAEKHTWDIRAEKIIYYIKEISI